MAWRVGYSDFVKAWHVGRSRVRIPRTPHNILLPTKNRVPHGSPRLGHVAPNYSPIKCHVSTIYSSTCPVKCLPRQLPHVSRTLPRQHPYGLYGLHSQHPFFLTCLTIRIERNISRSRRPFETKRVALDSQRQGLRSRSF
jgi:hypothetical protein